MFGLLGDVLIRTPVLKALRKIYPKSRIIAFVDPIGSLVLKNNQDCDEIVVVNRQKNNRLLYLFEKIKSLYILRKTASDLLIDLYDGGSSYGMARLSNAKYKLGYRESKKSFIYNIEHLDETQSNASLYEKTINVLKPLSREKFDLKPAYDILEESRESVSKYISDENIDLQKSYILNFGSGGVEKIMEFEKYLYLVEYIYEKYGYAPMIVSNPGQEYLQTDFIRDFLASSKAPYVKLPTFSLDEIASLISKSKFLVTPDTGLMHIAMAFNNYIYAIFTYTNPSLIDIGDEKLIAVYESFDNGVLYKKQNISKDQLQERIDFLLKKLSDV